jgi:predicted nucleic acid-binding protein
MNRILVDANVWLDVILEREMHLQESKNALKLAIENNYDLYLSASYLDTLYYISTNSRGKKLSHEQAHEVIQSIIDNNNLAELTEPIVKSAFGCRVDDLEDALVASAADYYDCEYILTRDKKFRETKFLPVEAISPEEWIRRFEE